MRFLLLLSLAVPAVAAAQVRQLRAVPDATFDASALDLSGPPALRVDRQNRVHLVDRLAITLSRLSPDGQQAEALMREGSGPGEARSLVALGWKGDSLWTFDPRLLRFTLLDGSGKFIRTITASERCTTRFGGALMAGDGCMEWVQPISTPAAASALSAPFPVLLTSQNRKQVDTLGQQGYAHTTMIFLPKDGMLHARQPFGDDGALFPTTDGRAVLEVQRSAAVAARTDSVRLRRWVRDSGWGSWHGISYEPLALSGRVFDSTLALQATQFQKQSPWLTLDSLYLRAFHPRFFPPAPIVLAASDGSVWVKLVHANSQPGWSTWVVLDGQLGQRSRVTAPAALTILDVRGDLCWGYVLDADDVPTVVRYKLVPAT